MPWEAALEKAKRQKKKKKSGFTKLFGIQAPSLVLFFFGLFAFSRAAPMAYGGSQARGRIGAVATGLRQSHSNMGSEPRLRPTPQLMATPDA